MFQSWSRRLLRCVNCEEACLWDSWRSYAQNYPATAAWNLIFKWMPPPNRPHPDVATLVSSTSLLMLFASDIILENWFQWRWLGLDYPKESLTSSCRLHPVLPPRSIQGFTSLGDSGHCSIISTAAKSSWVSCFIQFLSIHLAPLTTRLSRTGKQLTDNLFSVCHYVAPDICLSSPV